MRAYFGPSKKVQLCQLVPPCLPNIPCCPQSPHNMCSYDVPAALTCQNQRMRTTPQRPHSDTKHVEGTHCLHMSCGRTWDSGRGLECCSARTLRRLEGRWDSGRLSTAVRLVGLSSTVSSGRREWYLRGDRHSRLAAKPLGSIHRRKPRMQISLGIQDQRF